MAKTTGNCLCGAVQFSTDAAPVVVANCHCTDCRKATGAAYATLLFYKKEDVEISGDTHTYEHKSDRGSDMKKYFCPQCGSPMFGEGSGRPGFIGVRAGALNETEVIKPQRNVYISSMIASTPVNADLPSSEKMPS